MAEKAKVPEDFGEKIGGARKDVYAARQNGGLKIEDIGKWTSAERNEFIKKDNVFPKLDYQALLDDYRKQAEEAARESSRAVDSGDIERYRFALYYIKTIRDAIPVKPVSVFASPEEKKEYTELIYRVSELERLKRNGDTENTEELERVREKIASMEQEAAERGQSAYIETVSKVRDAVLQVKSPSNVQKFRANLIRDGIIVKSALATAQLDKKFAAVLNKTEYSLQKSMEKKQFLYSEDEKMLAKYRIQQYDGTNLRFGDSWAGKNCIVAKFPGSAYYYYMKNEDEQRRFMNPENWKKDTYFVTSSVNHGIIEHNFESEEEARQFVLERERASQERKKQTEQAFEKATGRKAAYRPPQLSHVRRKGENYREGKDIDGEQMMQTFGFRGGEFGNWENQNDRQTNLNMSYDALKDMAKALEIADRDISLGENLAIAYGSRGRGGASAAAAHYESVANVINLTKMNGAGCLAHEWGHALDAYLAKELKLSGDFATDYCKNPDNPLYDIINAMKYNENGEKTKFLRDAEELDKMFSRSGHQNGGYWQSDIEIFARAFSAYVDSKIEEKGEICDYLCRPSDKVPVDGIYIQPMGEELERINAEFDKLFENLRERGLLHERPETERHQQVETEIAVKQTGRKQAEPEQKPAPESGKEQTSPLPESTEKPEQQNVEVSDMTVVFEVEQYDEIRFFRTNESVEKLIETAKNSELPFVALGEMGKQISGVEFAEIQQSDKLTASAKFNLNDRTVEIMEINGGKGGIAEGDRNDSNISFRQVDFQEHEQQQDSLSIGFAIQLGEQGDEWFTESNLLYDFVQENPDCSFALGNAILQYLDEKQNAERNIPELKAGWNSKTNFHITGTVQGSAFSYDGRFDIGSGNGSLIDHIRLFNENILKYERYPYNQPEHQEAARNTLDVLVPFLESQAGLSAEEQKIMDDFKAKHPIRTHADVVKPQPETAHAQDTQLQQDDMEQITDKAKFLAEHMTTGTTKWGQENFGNINYRYIPQKAYTTVPETLKEDICVRLIQQGIKFSGVVKGDKVTFTVSEGDLEKLKAIRKQIETEQEKKQQAETAVPAPETDSPEEEQRSQYRIYQLPDGEKYHGIRFESREQLEKDGVQLNHEDYQLTYEGKMSAFEGVSTLEQLYTVFNENRPEDFTGRSLSVSDVVVIAENGTETAYFCDKAGFVEMPEFFREKELTQEKTAPDEISFSDLDFEKKIPHEMRWKEYYMVEDNTALYWVTQGIFTESDLEKFQAALRETGIEKAYVIPRDFSGYDFEDDMANHAPFAVVTHDSISCKDYIDEVKSVFHADVSKQAESTQKRDEFVPVYKGDWKIADNRELYREIVAENRRFAEMAKEVIGNGLNPADSVKALTEEFGFERTAWLTALNIAAHPLDGRLSSADKAWACETLSPFLELKPNTRFANDTEKQTLFDRMISGGTLHDIHITHLAQFAETLIPEYTKYLERSAAEEHESPTGTADELKKIYHDGKTAFYCFPSQESRLSIDTLPLITEKAERYVIAAASCILSEEFMQEHNITFLKCGRDLEYQEDNLEYQEDTDRMLQAMRDAALRVSERFTTLSEEDKQHIDAYPEAFISKPVDTPWGKAQECHEIAKGVFEVSTAGHGGIMIDAELAEHMLSHEAFEIGFFEDGYHCFEKDADAQIPLRELFDKGIVDIRQYVSEMYQKSYEELGEWLNTVISDEISTSHPDYWAAHENAIDFLKESDIALHPEESKPEKSSLRSCVVQYEWDSYPPVTFTLNDNDSITIRREGLEKTIRVEESDEYTYKVLKTKIKAIDGAEGFFNFLEEAVNDESGAMLSQLHAITNRYLGEPELIVQKYACDRDKMKKIEAAARSAGLGAGSVVRGLDDTVTIRTYECHREALENLVQEYGLTSVENSGKEKTVPVQETADSPVQETADSKKETGEQPEVHFGEQLGFFDSTFGSMANSSYPAPAPAGKDVAFCEVEWEQFKVCEDFFRNSDYEATPEGKGIQVVTDNLPRFMQELKRAETIVDIANKMYGSGYTAEQVTAAKDLIVESVDSNNAALPLIALNTGLTAEQIEAMSLKLQRIIQMKANFLQENERQTSRESKAATANEEKITVSTDHWQKTTEEIMDILENTDVSEMGRYDWQQIIEAYDNACIESGGGNAKDKPDAVDELLFTLLDGNLPDEEQAQNAMEHLQGMMEQEGVQEEQKYAPEEHNS